MKCYMIHGDLENAKSSLQEESKEDVVDKMCYFFLNLSTAKGSSTFMQSYFQRLCIVTLK